MSTDRLIITAVNFDLTEALKEHIIEKMNKVLTHDASITRLEIFLEAKTNEKPPKFIAKSNLTLHGNHFHAEYGHADCYHAVNELEKILLRDVRREHRKFQHQRKH